MSDGGPRHERRDTSPAGLWNRAQFDASLKVLRDIGLSARALEYFARRGRRTGRLPHELVAEFLDEALRNSLAALP